MTNTLSYPEVELDKIDIVDDFNARSQMDPETLQGMAKTIREVGVMQPIGVIPKDDDRYDLVFGHQRFEAAKIALSMARSEGADTSRLTSIRIIGSENDPYLEALIENEHRSGLNPVDLARGIRALAQEHNLTTHKEIADKIGGEKTPAWVGAHLRLLDLPECVQPYIAEGVVPIEGERQLRGVAKVSPEVAAAVCEVAKREEVTGRRFTVSFKELLVETARSNIKGSPPMLRVDNLHLSEIVSDEKKREQLNTRIRSLPSRTYVTSDPRISFTEADIDAARANGCLIEHKSSRNGFDTSLRFIIDREFAADLLERKLQREEQEVEEQALQNAGKDAAKRDKKKEQRKLQRQEALEDKAVARSWNERVGIALTKVRNAAWRKKRGLSWAKAVALVFIDQNETLAPGGIRLTLRDDLVQVEHTKLKSGKPKEVVTYAEKDQCTKELRRRVLAAKSEAEVNQVLAEAMVAAQLVDQAELAKSKQCGWHIPYRVRDEVVKLLAADVKEVRPRRAPKKTKKSYGPTRDGGAAASAPRLHRTRFR